MTVRAALTTAQAAETLGVSRETVRKWGHDGTLPQPERVAHVLTFDKDAVTELARTRKIGRRPR